MSSGDVTGVRKVPAQPDDELPSSRQVDVVMFRRGFCNGIDRGVGG
jgi:hypothetical protein